jgi:hypothetical protein
MNRRTIAAVVLTAALVGGIVHAATACTGFAVYSGRTLYGMNFDYPPNEIRFSIEEHEAGALFLGEFRMGEFWARTVGMNEHGLFASDQMVSPARATTNDPTSDELYVWNAFYDGLRANESVSEVLDWIGDRRLVQQPDLWLHNLYADPTGGAAIVEAGIAGNVITPIEGPFLVMTNFHNGDFRGLDLRSIVGDGAERYRVAYRHIAENLEGFDIDDAFETLRRTSTSTGNFKTRYSLVFDPEALEIYVALERDYDRIWRISLTGRTIETYRGFDRHHVLTLDDSGITGPDLQGYAGDEAVAVRSGSGFRVSLLGLLLGGLVVAGLLLLLK